MSGHPIPALPDPPEASTRTSRLWMLLPVGCLGAFALMAVIVFSGIAFMMNAIRASDVFIEAVAAAEANPGVQEALGTPIKTGFLITGGMHYSGPAGSANLAIPLSGPEGGATLYASAVMSEGEWSFTTLTVSIAETGERIDLLETDGEPV